MFGRKSYRGIFLERNDMKYEDYHNLIKWNIGRWSTRFRRYNIDVYELESLANLVFVRACNSFDPTRGVKFSTYLVKIINYEYFAFIKKIKKDKLRFVSVREPYYINYDKEVSSLWSQLDLLCPQYSYVLKGRCEGKSCTKIGQELGMSKQAVNQIEHKAIQEMKALYELRKT